MSNCVRKIIFIPCIFATYGAYAFPDGLALGVGMSALTGLNVSVWYRQDDLSSWLRNFGVRFDFADTAPLKSAFDSALNHIARDGVDVGRGVKIDNMEMDVSHYAALVDFYPFSGRWRLTSGLVLGDMKLDTRIKGEIENVPTQRFYFYVNGDHYYYNGNTFRGSVSIDWEYYGPYFGTGFDLDLLCNLFLYVDAGIIVTNRPAKLSMQIPHEQLYIYDTQTATWSPVTVPKLDSDVAAATYDANNKLSDIRIYPMLKLGFLYRF